MKINIDGLGYVGCVSAACLANEGFDVVGIDIDRVKVNAINRGKSPIIEPGLEDAIKKAVLSKKLSATTRDNGNADISVVCVGTPSNDNGSLNLDFIKKVAKEIGQKIRKTDIYHVVNFRSTVLPGTVDEVLIPILESSSKKKAGKDFGVCMNPEFMREGSSLHDYYNPPFTVIGQLNKKSGDKVGILYKNLNAQLVKTDIKVAETIKYACNAFHAVKVSFGNEIGNICKKLGVNSHKVMDVFCMDTKLNISPYYLKPGFAFGGSCLPKDLRAILYRAKEVDLDLPLLESVLPTNQKQIEIVYNMIKNHGKKNIGILGLSFKSGTDDLRESPMVELAEKLLGKGYEISIYDKEVSMAKVRGANKKYINKVIPHVSTLLKKSMSETFDDVDIIVVGKNNREFIDYMNSSKKKRVCIIDLVNIKLGKNNRTAKYEGICW